MKRSILNTITAALLPLSGYAMQPSGSYIHAAGRNHSVEQSSPNVPKVTDKGATLLVQLQPESDDLTLTRGQVAQLHTSQAVSSLELIQGRVAKELVIIDAGVPDKHLFQQQLKPGVDVHELNSNEDGLKQLKAILAQYQDVEALHLVSHADDGVLYLGDSAVTEAELKENVGTLAQLNHALKDGADLMLYGCDLARTKKGESLLELISAGANVDVAASNDLTGSGLYDSDWQLEIVKGDIESTMPFSPVALADFSEVLQVADGTVAFSSGWTDSNTSLDHNDFQLTGTCDTAVTDWNIAGGEAYPNGSSGSRPTTCAMTVAADGTNTASFELTDISFREYTADRGWTNVNVVGTRADGGGAVSSGNTSQTDDGAITTFSGASSDSGNDNGLDFSPFSGIAFSSFQINFTIPVSGTGNPSDFSFTSFTVQNATAPSSNATPTDITLSSSTIADVATGASAVVGTLTTADTDVSDTHSYTLMTSGATCNGTNGADNGQFAIDEQAADADDKLLTQSSLTPATYNICLQTSDGTATYQKAMTVTVSDTVAAVSTAAGFNTTNGTNLSPALTFDGSDETLTLGAAAHTTGSTANGAGGTDILVTVDGADLSQLSSLTGFETLTIPASTSVSMTSTQHNAFSTFTDNASQSVSLVSGSDSVTANSNIESYTLGSSYSGTLTLGAAGQNVTGADGAVDVVNVGTLSATGTLNGGTGTDELQMSTGATINGATVSGFENLTLASGASVSMTEAQHDAFSGTITAAGTEQITITAATDGFTANSVIETYVLGAANSVVMSGAAQNITGSSGDDIVNAGAFALAGTVSGGTGTDTLTLSTGANISGGTVSGFENLTVASGGSYTMTASQSSQFSGSINAAGTETVTVNGDGDFTTLANIETYTVDDDSSNTRTISLGAANTSVSAITANDAITFNIGALNYAGTLTGEGTVNDTLSMGDGSSISSANLSNIENLTIASGASVTMTEAQHDGFTGTVSATGTQQITLSSAVDGVLANSAIETYVLGAANSITLSTNAQSVTGSTGNDTVNIGARTITGTLNGAGGTDTLAMSNGASLVSGSVSNFENLNLALNGTFSALASQMAQFTGTISATGGETFNISGDGDFTTLSNIETFSVGDSSSNTRNIVVSSAGTSVTASEATDTVTFDLGALAYTATITGDGSTNDTLSLADGADISGGSIVAVENLTLTNDAAVTMTTGQFNGFTGTVTAAGDETVNLSGDGDFSTVTAIETYSVDDSSTDARTITITGIAHSVTANSASDAVVFDAGGVTLTGSLIGESSVTDTLSLGNGANISSATISNIENLTLASGAPVTMTEAQHDAFTGTVTAPGTEQITITDATDGFTASSVIETYVLGAANTVTLSAAGQSISGSTGNDTVNAGALTVTGSLIGSSGTDTLSLTTGADISGATVTTFENLTLASGGSYTMAASQSAQFTGTVTAAGSETMNVNGNGNFTTLANIETYSVDDDSTNSRTITLGAADTDVSAITANDAITFTVGALTYTGTLTGEGTVNDTLSLQNGADVTGGTFNNIENLSIASGASVSITQAQLAGFSGTVTGTGTQSLTVSGNGDITTNSEFETYVVGDSSTNARTITVSAAGTSVTDNSTNDAVVFDLGNLTYTGTITGETTVADSISVDSGADLTGATITNVPSLTIDTSGAITLDQANLDALTTAITGSSGSDTLILSGAVTYDFGSTTVSEIEAISLGSNAAYNLTLTDNFDADGQRVAINNGSGGAITSSVTIDASAFVNDALDINTQTASTMLNGGVTIIGGSGADTIRGGTGTDSFTGGAGNDLFWGSATGFNGDTITDLAAGDKIIITGNNSLTTSNVRFSGSNTLQIDTDATDFSSVEVSITLSDGAGGNLTIDGVTAAGANSEITFASANDAPVFTGLNGGATFTEDGSAVVIDSDVTVADTELDALNSSNGNYNGATLTIARNGGANSEDQFANSGLLGTLTESSSFTYNSTAVGTVTTNSGGTLVLAFNASATSAIVDSVLQSIAYSNSSDTPATSVTLDYTFNDGTANSSGTNQATVSITATNDAPTITSTAVTSATEDSVYLYALTATDPENDAVSWKAASGSTLPAWLSIASVTSQVSTFAGSGSSGSTNGTGAAASFNSPYDVDVDSAGNVYVADRSNHLIRKISPAGVVTTLAGSGSSGSSNGTGTAASFSYPNALAVDSSGNVYVADASNNLVRKITAAGVVTTLAGSGSYGSSDGTGVAATFSAPTGIAVDSNGNVFVVETNTHKIRKITPAGVVTTFAGSGSQGSNDATGTSASFNYPYNLDVDASDNLYLADRNNHTIRKITPAGVVTTLAGTGSTGSTDATGTAASFNKPYDVAVDSDGNVYVADQTNYLIRKITPAGVVTTIAGTGSPGAVNGDALSSTFNSPFGIAVDSSGNIFVADQGNHSVRKLSQGGIALTGTPTNSEVGNHNACVVATDGTDDSSSQCFTIAVAGVNDAPTVGTNTGATFNEGSTTALSNTELAAADVDDSAAGLTFTVTTLPARGSLFVDGNNNDTLDSGEALTLNGTFTQQDLDSGNVFYQHDGSETTSDSFVFSLADGGEDGAAAVTGQTFSITVTPQNDVPTDITWSAASLSQSAAVAGVNVGTVSTTDADTGDSHTYSLVAIGSSTAGTCTSAANNAMFTVSGSTLKAATPLTAGTYNFCLQSSDGTGSYQESFSLTISDDVSPSGYSVSIDQTVITLSNETAMSFTIANAEVGATYNYSVSGASGTPVTGSGTVATATQQVTGVNVQSLPEGTLTLTLSLTDADTNAGSNVTATVVKRYNTAPVIVEGSSIVMSLAEDSVGIVNLSATDADGDSLVWSIAGQGGSGVASVTTSGIATTVTYTPVINFNGSDVVTVRVSDGTEVDTIAVNVTVSAVNDAPGISGSPRTSVKVGEAYSFTPVAVDVDSSTLTFSISNGPSWATFDTQTGTLRGTPVAADKGTTSGVIISVSDGTLSSSLPPFNIVVSSDNDAPTAQPLSVSGAEDNAISIAVSGQDPNGDELTYELVSAPANGTVDTSSALWRYTPEANFNGTDSFTYSASDGDSVSEAVTVSITVTPVNDIPEAIDDSFELDANADGSYSLNVLANDKDVDGDELIIDGASASIGSVAISGSQLIYQAQGNFVGAVSLRYGVRDGKGGRALASVSLIIKGQNSGPVITAPSEVEVNATGLFTKVDLGVATAVDAQGNPVPVSLKNGKTTFQPGEHIVYWQAEDSQGNQSTVEQKVIVHPLVSLSKDRSTREGGVNRVSVILNGSAPSYPVDISYSVGGTATPGVDHNLQSGVVTITNGRRGMIQFEVLSDEVVETDETIVITLDEGINRGAKSTTTLTISEQNIAPEVMLDVKQAGESRLTVSQDGGVVDVLATVTDPNPNDTLSHNWQGASALSNISSDDMSFSFDPSVVAPGVYKVSLEVVDSGTPSKKDKETVYIKVEETLVTLGDGDTDGDLIPDDQEGFADSDGDGIPDYQDAISDCNVMPSEVQNQDGFLIEGDPGVCIRLGEISAQGQSGGLLLTNDDGQQLIPQDDDADNIGGVFDYIAYGLPEAGQLYNVVIPQQLPVPAGAVFRKYTETKGWYTFVEDASNVVSSAPGEQGICPPPGDSSWTAGLAEGHWCVQLTIEDGGPNDDDGEVNGSIVDPGGVAVLKSANSLPVASNDVAELRMDTSISIDVLANDTDADGDTLAVSSASANFGDVVINDDSSLTYTPNTGYFGSDVIVYGVTDGKGGTASGEVAVTVIANQIPQLGTDTAQVASGNSVTIDVLANDSDADGDTLTVISAEATAGTVTVNSDNTLTYQAASDYEGVDTVSYTVSDGFVVVTGTVEITVSTEITPPPPPPKPPVEVENRSGGSLYWMLVLLIAMAFTRSQAKRRGKY